MNLAQLSMSYTPRCLVALELGDASIDSGGDLLRYQVLQSGQEARVEVLGFPLSELRPELREERGFASPLSLRWSDGRTVEVFDSNIHGYHGELDCSAKLRGRGKPTAFVCESCEGRVFHVVLEFRYISLEEILEDENPDRALDYFSGMKVLGTCVACGFDDTVLGMAL